MPIKVPVSKPKVSSRMLRKPPDISLLWSEYGSIHQYVTCCHFRTIFTLDRSPNPPVRIHSGEERDPQALVALGELRRYFG